MFGRKRDEVVGSDTKSLFTTEREGRWAVRSTDGMYLVQKVDFSGYSMHPIYTFVWVDGLEVADLTGHTNAVARVSQMPKGCAQAVRVVRQVLA